MGTGRFGVRSSSAITGTAADRTRYGATRAGDSVGRQDTGGCAMIDTQNRPDAAHTEQDAKKIKRLLGWWNEVRDFDDENRREMAIN